VLFCFFNYVQVLDLASARLIKGADAHLVFYLLQSFIILKPEVKTFELGDGIYRLNLLFVSHIMMLA